MVQTQKIISERALSIIRMAEQNDSPNEAANAAALLFKCLRKDQVSLTDLLAQKTANQIFANPPSSISLMEKLQLTAEVKDLKASIENFKASIVTLREKNATSSQNLVVAKNEIRELRGALKSAKKDRKAEMAETKAELKAVRKQAAAGRAKLAALAKSAPISAADVVSTRRAKAAASAHTAAPAVPRTRKA